VHRAARRARWEQLFSRMGFRVTECELIFVRHDEAGKLSIYRGSMGRHVVAGCRAPGEKTVKYELVEQFGWRVPDVVVYPTRVVWPNAAE
jgi:hypothetical protein